MNTKKSTWNWEAAFLAPWYFAKYGRWGIALVLAFFAGSLIPIFMIVTFIFSGFFANKILSDEISPKSNIYLLYVSLFFALVIFSQLRVLM